MCVVAGGSEGVCEGKRVEPRDEGVVDVARSRWRMVDRLGRYATTRLGLLDDIYTMWHVIESTSMWLRVNTPLAELLKVLLLFVIP